MNIENIIFDIDLIIMSICFVLFIVIVAVLYTSALDSEIQDNYLRDYYKDDDHYN